MSQITVTHAHLEEMYNSIRNIGNSPNLEASMRFARNIQKLEKPYKAYVRKLTEIQAEMSAKKPNGDILLDERTNNIVYTNRIEADKAFQELADKETTFEVVPIETGMYPKEMWAKIPANLLAALLDTVIIESDTLKLVK